MIERYKKIFIEDIKLIKEKKLEELLTLKDIKNDAFFNLTPHFVILCNYSIFFRDLQYFFR